MKHRIRLDSTTALVKRTDMYGKRLPSPGGIEAFCEPCNWHAALRHYGTDLVEKEAELDALVKAHVDGEA